MHKFLTWIANSISFYQSTNVESLMFEITSWDFAQMVNISLGLSRFWVLTLLRSDRILTVAQTFRFWQVLLSLN